jgi:hypothetical protein
MFIFIYLSFSDFPRYLIILFSKKIIYRFISIEILKIYTFKNQLIKNNKL